MTHLEQKARDAAVRYGLYSPEYADAVREMNQEWLTRKLTLREKIINYLNKRLWLRIQNNC